MSKLNLSKQILNKRKELLSELDDKINEIANQINTFYNDILIKKLSLNDNKLFLNFLKQLAINELSYKNNSKMYLDQFLELFYNKNNLTSLDFDFELSNDNYTNAYLRSRKLKENYTFVYDLWEILRKHEANAEEIIKKINKSNNNYKLIFNNKNKYHKQIIIQFNNINQYLNIELISDYDYWNRNNNFCTLLYFNFYKQVINIEGVLFKFLERVIEIQLKDSLD